MIRIAYLFFFVALASPSFCIELQVNGKSAALTLPVALRVTSEVDLKEINGKRFQLESNFAQLAGFLEISLESQFDDFSDMADNRAKAYSNYFIEPPKQISKTDSSMWLFWESENSKSFAIFFAGFFDSNEVVVGFMAETSLDEEKAKIIRIINGIISSVVFDNQSFNPPLASFSDGQFILPGEQQNNEPQIESGGNKVNFEKQGENLVSNFSGEKPTPKTTSLPWLWIGAILVILGMVAFLVIQRQRG